MRTQAVGSSTRWAIATCARRMQHTHNPSAPPSQEPAASAASKGVSNTHPSKDSQSFTALYPRMRLRATTQERPYKRRSFVAFEETETLEQVSAGSEPQQRAALSQSAPAPSEANADLLAFASPEQRKAVDVTAPAVASASALSLSPDAPHQRSLVHPLPEGNQVQQFLDEVQRQAEVARYERNQAIPLPENPEVNAPVFRRVKRHAKMTIEVPDPDYPTFARKDQAVPLPPPQEHPWVKKNTPIGPFIVHGDGQINHTGGTGQVDFDDSSVDEKLPKSYRGLQHRPILQRQLPQDNGRVLQDAIIKHSFSLTGRGVFATHRIAKGEHIMVVQSTARNVGVKGELARLEEMCADILTACRDGDERSREFLHDWILTGQPSSLLEHWPGESTSRVIEAIGGADVLAELELHPIHVARLAAIVDLNSFLVESSFADRKGMAYFPEAGFLNHSCVPNATYDMMPEHVFRGSDYYLNEAADVEAAETEESAAKMTTKSGDVVHTATCDGKRETGTATVAFKTVSQAAPPATSSTHEVTVHDGVTTARNAAYFDSKARLAIYPDLTEADAPVYLFCCRAEKDIEPGEEILISYVPPQWSFDNRQYVLHDRYHFWCKCPKCAPVLDKKYARLPKMLVGLVVLSILLQMLVFYQRDLKNAVDEDFNRLAAMSEEDRLEELRARGISPEEVSVDGAKKRRQNRHGLFEMMEEERLRKVYEHDNRGHVNIMNRMDPMSEPPR